MTPVKRSLDFQRGGDPQVENLCIRTIAFRFPVQIVNQQLIGVLQSFSTRMGLLRYPTPWFEQLPEPWLLQCEIVALPRSYHGSQANQSPFNIHLFYWFCSSGDHWLQHQAWSDTTNVRAASACHQWLLNCLRSHWLVTWTLAGTFVYRDYKSHHEADFITNHVTIINITVSFPFNYQNDNFCPCKVSFMRNINGSLQTLSLLFMRHTETAITTLFCIVQSILSLKYGLEDPPLHQSSLSQI